jgi:hypothetical protein
LAVVAVVADLKQVEEVVVAVGVADLGPESHLCLLARLRLQ